MSIDPERYQIDQPIEEQVGPESLDQTPTPPPHPNVQPTFALLSLIERGVYTQAGLPPQIIKQIEDPASRKVVADTLEMLGLPRAILNVDGMSPTMRWILLAGVLGGYGYLVYSQAKTIKKSLTPAPLPQPRPQPTPQSPSAQDIQKKEELKQEVSPEDKEVPAGTVKIE